MYLGFAAFGPVSLDLIQQYHLNFKTVLPYALRDVSAVFMATIAFLLTDWLAAAAIAFGFLLFLVFPFLFQFCFVCSALIFGLIACDHPEQLVKHRLLVLLALLLAAPAALLTDLAGSLSGLAWLVCIGGTVWVALSGQRPLAWSGMRRAAASTALLLSLGLVAVGRGYLSRFRMAVRRAGTDLTGPSDLVVCEGTNPTGRAHLHGSGRDRADPAAPRMEHVRIYRRAANIYLQSVSD